MFGFREGRRFGRLPNDPSRPRLRLWEDLSAGGVTPPGSADWLSGVPAWGMALNDRIGDCTAAGACHVALAIAHYGEHVDLSISDDAVLAMYEAISGYDPSDPSTDVGATLQDALGYWKATGIGGHRITAFAQIDPTNLPLVRACVATFGAVYTGMNFPSSAMDQFDAGQPWSVVGRSAIEGGHCVPIGAYDANSFTCVTWGRTQVMDVGFFQRYFDECWVPIDLDWLSATGLSPAGLDVAQLNADFEELTGQPGPFPAPPPAPAPTPPAPQPAPAPAPPDADTVFAAAARVWLQAKGL